MVTEATELVREILQDDEWHWSREIHERLRLCLSVGMFGRVKRELAIEHRRVGGGEGTYYEWRLSQRG